MGFMRVDLSWVGTAGWYGGIPVLKCSRSSNALASTCPVLAEPLMRGIGHVTAVTPPELEAAIGSGLMTSAGN